MSYPSVNQQFESLSKNFNNIPRLVISNPEPKKPIKTYKPIGEDEYNKEAFYSKIEFWIFSIVTAIVLGYAGIRLIDYFLR